MVKKTRVRETNSQNHNKEIQLRKANLFHVLHMSRQLLLLIQDMQLESIKLFIEGKQFTCAFYIKDAFGD